MGVKEENEIDQKQSDQETIVDDTSENLTNKVYQAPEDSDPDIDPNIGQTDVKLQPIDIHDD